MGKRKRYTQWIEFKPKADRKDDEQAQERMAEALAAYQGPITKCSPKSAQARKLSASAQVAKRWTRPV
jgi:DNA invertase Pin-like site-specific DNA recombinase